MTPVGGIKIGNSVRVYQRGLGAAEDDREARGAIPTGRMMSPEEFVRSLESPGVGVSAGCLGELQASAQLVLKSKFVSHFTSRDRLSRRYARELPIVHLWGAIFLHSSWLNEGRVYPIHSAALASLTGLTLPTVSRAVSLAAAQGDVERRAFEEDFRRRTVDPMEHLFLYRLQKTEALVRLWSELTGRPDPWGRMTDTTRRDVMSVQCYFVRRAVLSNRNSPMDRNQFLTLLALAACGSIPEEQFVGQHSRAIGMTRMGMALLLERLVARGLVRRGSSGSVTISCATQQVMSAVVVTLRRRFNTLLDLVEDVSLLSGVSSLVRNEVISLSSGGDRRPDRSPRHTG